MACKYSPRHVSTPRVHKHCYEHFFLSVKHCDFTQYRKYNAIWSRGSHFWVEKIDKNHKTYDCGVMVTFDQDASTSTNTKVPLDYYGLIQDILEVIYRRLSHFILHVRWFKVIKRGRNATVRCDPYGLYVIDSKAIWRDKNDTFVFPHQCEQVCTD